MFDLDTIRYQNEQAYLSSLRMVNKGVTQTEAPRTEPVYPLAILASKLITGPPSLVRLIDLLGDSDSIAYFLELVREYLPEHEAEIMSGLDDMSRIGRFSRYFGNRYFPLPEGNYYDDFTISDFVQYIPIELMGFTWEDYEEFNQFRDGFILLLSMVESPYDSNERVPLLERVKELVGKSLVELIPPEGWSLEDIHKMFDGSKYEGFAAFADWIHSTTDCWQLDANYSEYAPEEWSREIVDGLTRQWPEVQDLQDKMHAMYEWLEKDIVSNFRILLEMMLEEKIEVEIIPKEQIPFPLDDEGQVI